MTKKKMETELKKFLKFKGISQENINEILSDLNTKIEENKDGVKYDRKTGKKKAGVGYGTSCFGIETKDGRRDIEF